MKKTLALSLGALLLTSTAALAQEEMGKLTGGMDLPFKLPF